VSAYATPAYDLHSGEYWRPNPQQRHLLDAVEQLLAARTPARRAMAKLEVEQALGAWNISGENRLLWDLFEDRDRDVVEHINLGRRASDRIFV
jgi:hypothetical protein